jgi:SAM-dependent methyltransferase
MTGDGHVAAKNDPSPDGGGEQRGGLARRWTKAVFDRTPWGRRLNRYAATIRKASDRLDAVEDVSRRLQARLDEITDRTDARLDALEDSLRALQTALDDRLVSMESRLDIGEGGLASVSAEAARLRDEVVPAMVGRADALLERLAGEIDEVGSLVERMLRDEPLPPPIRDTADEAELAQALAEVQPALLEAFRGPESEIHHRLDRYLEELGQHHPVLDLGCGRGELLLMLREAGVEASGIEADPAVAQAARRRGLDVIEGDVLEALRRQPDASRGAVTAIHLFEHLDPSAVVAVVAEIRRVLRPGGLLVVECPNPHSLRVGGSLFWLDPTHRRPLMPETLELYLTTGGLEIETTEYLHPFPADQLLCCDDGETAIEDPVVAALAERIDRLGQRLDEMLSGHRDFVVRARKPDRAMA